MIIYTGIILIFICVYTVLKNYNFYIKHKLYRSCSVIICLSLFLINFYTRDRYVNNGILNVCLRKFVSPLLGVQYVVKNKENLPKQGPYIMVANHPTRFDTLGLSFLAQFIKKWKIIATDLLKKSFINRLCYPKLSFHFIPMNNTEMAIEILDKLALEAKTDNSVIHIRPEGLTREDGTIHAFKKGAFHLAIKHKLPIVPVVYSKHYFYDVNLRKFDKGVVYLSVLPLIQTENLTKRDVRTLSETTRNLMNTEFENLNINN